MALPASDVLIVFAEISVALVGFSGIIAVFRQRGLSSWPAHVAFRFLFMCWQAFFTMAAALLPFVPFHTARFSENTWQISSAIFAASAVWLMFTSISKARHLPAASKAKISSGWMIAYQSGSFLIVILLAANALSLLDTSGPAAYLIALGWNLFIAGSLFARLLIDPGSGTDE